MKKEIKLLATETVHAVKPLPPKMEDEPLERPKRLILRMFTDDMGSFTQPGCTSIDDALWHVNKAREHDGLSAMSREQFCRLFNGTGWGHASLKLEN